MWDVRIISDHIVGLHKCKNEKAWMVERDGWAIVDFMFEDYFKEGHNMCSACNNKIPTEIVNFYKFCKMFYPGSSED
jgi:hypothetical protein